MHGIVLIAAGTPHAVGGFQDIVAGAVGKALAVAQRRCDPFQAVHRVVFVGIDAAVGLRHAGHVAVYIHFKGRHMPQCVGNACELVVRVVGILRHRAARGNRFHEVVHHVVAVLGNQAVAVLFLGEVP